MRTLSWICVILASGLALTSCANEQMDLVKSRHAMINGTKDTTDPHKAVVSLYISSWYSSYSACTGTLIHPQWVLTAAHCVADFNSNGNPRPSEYNSLYKIGIGNSESQFSSYEIDKIYYNSEYAEREPEYFYQTLDADIALLKLKKAVPESVATPILPLPKWLGINRAAIQKGVNLEFVGFGYNEKGNSGTKLAFTGPLNDYCGAADNDKATGCKNKKYMINGCHPSPDMCEDEDYAEYCTTGKLCVKNYADYVWLPHGSLFYLQEDGGPCQGDSGGPAFYKTGGIEYVAGITSYGDPVCAKTGISTAVQDYYDWIISKAPEVATQYKEICGNNLDDDGNGKIDCNDSACAGKSGCGSAQAEICNNGSDDDGDGLADCQDADCQEDSYCKTSAEICNNNIDDDQNGFMDCNDPACNDSPFCNVTNVEICNNNIDDDNNGLMDCNDPACNNSQFCHDPQAEICNNNIDDDINGLIDCNDPACLNDPSCNNGSAKQEICNNNTDDDNNGFIDCKDPACANTTLCTAQGNSSSVQEVCNNNVDDDNNGFADCLDHACKLSPFCVKEYCDNQLDDNHDGLIDCNDPYCANHLSCAGSGILYETCNNQTDDNANGLVDCQDPQCSRSIYCNVTQSGENCNNTQDDDGDGLADCFDPDCSTMTECALGSSFGLPFDYSHCQSNPLSRKSGFPPFVLLLLAFIPVLLSGRKLTKNK